MVQNFGLWQIAIIYAAYLCLAFLYFRYGRIGYFLPETEKTYKYTGKDIDYGEGIELRLYESDLGNVMVLVNNSGGNLYNLKLDINRCIGENGTELEKLVDIDKLEDKEHHILDFIGQTGDDRHPEIKLSWESHSGITHDKEFILGVTS